MAAGYIYLLLNSSMPGLVKIGKTERLPTGRADELSASSGVPTPFVVGYHVWVGDCDQAECLIHDRLSRFRTSQRREFFEIPATDAIHVIQGACAELNAGVAPAPLTVGAPSQGKAAGASASARRNTRTYERLGPVIGEVRTRMRGLQAWAKFLANEAKGRAQLRELSETFTWYDVPKAAKAVSTVSLRVHDELLDLREPLRDVSVSCAQFRDWALREMNSGRAIETEQDEFVIDLQMAIHNVLPRLQAVYDELIAFVPALADHGESAGA